MTFDAVLPSQKVRMVRMILSLMFLMNQTSMTRITPVVLVSTQQAHGGGGRAPELSSE